MGGTRAGGLKIRDLYLARDPDYYKKIGSMGGKATTGYKGFARMSKEQVSAAGRKGGAKGKRGPHPEGCTCRSHNMRDWATGRQRWQHVTGVLDVKT